MRCRISYEMSFYLVLPLLIGAVRLRTWTRLRRMLFLAMGLVLCLALAPLIRMAYVRFGMFLVGILLYEALSAADFKARLNRVGEVLVLAVGVGSLALVSLLDLRQQWFAFLPGLSTHYGVYCAGLLSVSFGALTAYALGYPGLIQAVCSWAPLRWLGNMSYSYYLIHGLTLKAVSMVLFRFFAPSGHSPILFGCMFGVGLLATLLSSTAHLDLDFLIFVSSPPERRCSEGSQG